MSEQSLIPVPKAQITIGGKSLQEIPDAELIEKIFRDSADKLVLRAESIEIIGDERRQAIAASVLNDMTAFIRERNDATDRELAPFKAAVKKINSATEILLSSVIVEKTRIVVLLSRFAEHQRKLADDARLKQEKEVRRIQAEAAELDRQRQELARNQAQTNAAPSSPSSTAEAIATDQKQQELSLKQAELNRQAAEASKVIEPPKVEGLATTTKWTFRVIGETDQEMKGSMVKAMLVHPDWFNITCQKRVIEAALKAADGKLECPGLLFFEETKARSA